MDHSVKAYIARQPAQNLMEFLRERLEKNDFANYRRAVADILEELASRGERIPPEIVSAWYRYLSENR